MEALAIFIRAQEKPSCNQGLPLDVGETNFRN